MYRKLNTYKFFKNKVLFSKLCNFFFQKYNILYVKNVESLIGKV